METIAALDAFGALSQGTRLKAFRLLVKHEPEGLAAGDLARLLSVPANTLSAHLNVLTQAHLVTSVRMSRSIIYRAQLSRIEELVLFLLEDCRSGRSGVHTQILENVMRQLSVRPKGR
jgi:DNA-binding transcriptional ArsR family regulator